MIKRGPSLATYGLTTLTAVVIGNMVGAGVFTTSGFALADLHTPERVVAAWIIGGGIALCGAIAYGALASVLQESGGEYLFLSRWVHPAVGFLAGWVSLLAGFTGAIALAALTLESYLHSMDGWLASGAILLCALLHGIRKAPGAWVQNLVVAGKLILLGAFVAVACFSLGNQSAPMNPAPGLPSSPFSLERFAESLMWISLSYAGFNAAVYVAGEAREASLVPKALLLGTTLTMLLYVGLNAVFVYADPGAIAGQRDVAALAAKALGGRFLEGLTRVVIPLALFTSVSAMMLAGPRVYAQMARDGWLPASLRLRGEAASPPRGAIFLQAILAILLVWVSSIRELLSYLGFTLSISSACAVASLWCVHRRRLATVHRYQLVAASIYVFMTLVSAVLGARLNPWEGLAGVGTLVLGYVVYLVLKRLRTA